MLRSLHLVVAAPLTVALAVMLWGPLTVAAAPQEDQDEDALTLERLFPEDGLFGPSARNMAFSNDGRYAAYLYRPYLERRHGSDLWVYDFETDQARRLTSVSVLAPFQQETREVQEDRVEKARKAVSSTAGASEGSEQEGLTEEQQRGDWVSDEDADDEEAPRYDGVSTYTWSPVASELLFTAGGDIYRLDLAAEAPLRLTRTHESEGAVSYLPDGSGYLYMQGDRLIKVVFGDHLIEQIDPELPAGESMSGYALSPDGKRLVLITRKGDSPFSSDRTVRIVNYRGRFAEVREVSRTVADDPRPKQELHIYFYGLDGNFNEESDLVKVYQTELTGPRDVVSAPEWALDSSRVVFSVFLQETEQVHVLIADYPEEPEASAEVEDGTSAGDAGEDTAADDAAVEAATEAESDEGEAEPLARLVYRFLHHGGPNTPRMVRPRFIFDSRRVVLLSELSGFRHVHLLDPLYESLQQLTSGSHEVYPLELSRDSRWLFATSTRDNPAREEVYRVNLETGAMEKVSSEPGEFSSVAVSDNGQRVLANFVTFGRLPELVRIQTQPTPSQTTVTDSHPAETLELIEPIPEFFSYENRHGHTIHGTLFKPQGWTANDARPLLIYVYGGPLGTRKMVVDGSYSADSYFFAYYMARRHGYVTVTIDPRGLSGYGSVFERANYQQIGRPQVEDLVDGVEFLVNGYGVDRERVGIHGWSFGGFQTQMCLYTAPEVFAVGMAGAGPTEWENYNAWYTTGTVGPSREGETDQAEFSLLPLAKNLQGRLLLVHGMEDSNVLYQDTVKVYRELLQAGKETLVELFLDPTGGHGLGGDVKRLNRYRKYEEFLLRTLGSGP